MLNLSMNVPHIQQEREYSCLPACVRMVLAFYGEHYSEGELRRLLKTRVTGTSPASVMLNLPDLGFDAYVFDASHSFLRQRITDHVPCIVHLWTGHLPYWRDSVIHAVVVTDIREDTILINDPMLETPGTAVPLDAFLDAWAATDHTLILITPKDRRSS